jgi:uncharacterized protein
MANNNVPPSPQPGALVGFNPIYKVSGVVRQTRSTIDRPGLIAHLRSQFRLDWCGLQGIPHWARVRANGLMLASDTGANTHVVELFAFFHAACLQDEDESADEDHLERSRKLVRDLHMIYFNSDESEMLELLNALIPVKRLPRFYKGSETCATCLDADALDMWRFGAVPSGTHDLITQPAKWTKNRERSERRALAWLCKWQAGVAPSGT